MEDVGQVLATRKEIEQAFGKPSVSGERPKWKIRFLGGPAARIYETATGQYVICSSDENAGKMLSYLGFEVRQ